MKGDLIEMAFLDFERGDPARAIIEEMRQKFSTVVGVTVVDPYVTVRWRIGRSHVEVSMLVTSITDSSWVEQPLPDDEK